MGAQRDPTDSMTKRQQLAECLRLAPDFAMRFETPGDVPTVTVRCTAPDGPIALSMVVGGLGRAAVETRLLEAALGRLRGRSRAA